MAGTEDAEFLLHAAKTHRLIAEKDRITEPDSRRDLRTGNHFGLMLQP